jgi:hypothetical protein
MKAALYFLLLFALPAPLRALDFATHPFFKHLVGEWEATGELKGADNNIVTITEKWTGKADAADSFYIEGTRTFNGETGVFKWTITHNAATDGYDAVLSGDAATQDIRFEGSLSDVDMVLSLKAITGGGDSSIALLDSFVDESKDTYQTKVTLTDEQGQTTLEGTITHKRVKAP